MSMFFTANPQMFAERNRFANPEIKTLSPKFAEVPSTVKINHRYARMIMILRKCRPVLLLMQN